MKQIIHLTSKQIIALPDIENRVKSARNSNDYILITFGRSGNLFIKISFHKDMTYNIGYNIWNLNFFTKTNLLVKQYPKSANIKLASYLFEWINRFNR